MRHDGHAPIELTDPVRPETLAYRLGRPRFVHRETHYLSIPVVCRRHTAVLLTGAALRHGHEWLERHGVDPSTPELLHDDVARIVDLDWPRPFRNGNSASAAPNRLAFGWRYLVEFAAGDMLAAAVGWDRYGGGRLVSLADIR